MSTRWEHAREGCFFSVISLPEEIAHKKSTIYFIKSKLIDRNKTPAINSQAFQVICNTTGIISWTQNKITELETKTRKTLHAYAQESTLADCVPLEIKQVEEAYDKWNMQFCQNKWHLKNM